MWIGYVVNRSLWSRLRLRFSRRYAGPEFCLLSSEQSIVKLFAVSTARTMPGGFQDRQSLEKGQNQRALCRWCRLEVPRGRYTFCSEWCVHEWRLRSDPGYL